MRQWKIWEPLGHKELDGVVTRIRSAIRAIDEMRAKPAQKRVAEIVHRERAGRGALRYRFLYNVWKRQVKTRETAVRSNCAKY